MSLTTFVAGFLGLPILLSFFIDVPFDTLHWLLILSVLVALVHPLLGIPNITCYFEKAPTPPSTTISEPTQTKKENPYKDRLEASLTEFLDLVDTEKYPCSEDGPWKSVASFSKKEFSVDVQARKDEEFFFRIITEFNGTPTQVFDLMADIYRRSEWDETCETGFLVENVSPSTKVQVMRTKAFWPTAARDALVVGCVKELPDGRLVNVTQSIDSHPLYTPRAGDVRMNAKLAAFIVGPHPSGDPDRCLGIQIMNGDLGGWLPPAIVSLVTTQAFPISMRRFNKLLLNEEKSTVSKVIENAKKSDVEQVAPPPPTTEVQVDRVKYVLNMLEKSQPVIVFLMFLLVLFKRK